MEESQISPAPAEADEPTGAATDTGRVSVPVPAITAIAVVGLIVAIVALVLSQIQNNSLNQKVNQQQARIQQLQSQQAANQAAALAALTSKVATDSQTVSVQGHSLASLNSQLSSLVLCVPELQQEVNGLNINTNSTGGYLTGAVLNNPTIVSSNCNSTLNGG